MGNEETAVIYLQSGSRTTCKCDSIKYDSTDFVEFYHNGRLVKVVNKYLIEWIDVK